MAPLDTSSPSSPSSVTKAIQPFIGGGISGCLATCIIQPVDMIKTRMQLLGEVAYKSSSSSAIKSRSPIEVVRYLYNTEGLIGFYKGLDAGLLRQATYTTARFGLFRSGMNYLSKDEAGNAKVVPFYQKMSLGFIVGGVASLCGTPADVSLVRLQADTTLPINERRNYTGVINAMNRIVKDEGVLALWRGASPTVLRAMFLNLGMLGTFDQAKEILKPTLGTGLLLSTVSSGVAGIAATLFSLPFDFLKTRLQRMKPDPVTGLNPYKNIFDCAKKTYQYEGALRFYTGLPVYYMRIAPHAMMALVLLDVYMELSKKYFGG